MMFSELKIVKRIRFFFETRAGEIFKDVLRFYFIWYLINFVIGLLSYLYMYFSLETLKIKVPDNDFTRLEIPDVDIDELYGDISAVITWAKLIPIILALFSVFFSVRPKPFRRVLITACWVALIGSLNLQDLLSPYNLLGGVVLLLGALAVWALSIIWYKWRFQKDIG